MDQEKVKDIGNWLTPKSIFEVRSFHDLESFYRKFIGNFRGICTRIIETIKGSKRPFKWKYATDKSFKLLKNKIIEQPFLTLPYFSKLFQVECDASGTAIRSVLSQEMKLVAYFSENLNESKHKYSSYDKEFYAIIINILLILC